MEPDVGVEPAKPGGVGSRYRPPTGAARAGWSIGVLTAPAVAAMTAAGPDRQPRSPAQTASPDRRLRLPEAAGGSERSRRRGAGHRDAPTGLTWGAGAVEDNNCRRAPGASPARTATGKGALDRSRGGSSSREGTSIPTPRVTRSPTSRESSPPHRARRGTGQSSSVPLPRAPMGLCPSCGHRVRSCRYPDGTPLVVDQQPAPGGRLIITPAGLVIGTLAPSRARGAGAQVGFTEHATVCRAADTSNPVALAAPHGP